MGALPVNLKNKVYNLILVMVIKNTGYMSLIIRYRNTVACLYAKN
jgi:hypothetical protein